MRAPKTSTRIRKDQIALAALAMVGESGPEALAVAPLARRVGLVPSAIYRHYPGKRQIVDAILDLVRHRLLDNVSVARAAGGDALKTLAAIFNAHVRLLEEHPGIPRLVFSPEALAWSQEPLSALLAEYAAALEAILAEGQRRGEVRPGVDPAAAAVAFLGLLQPAALMQRLGVAIDLPRHARCAWDIYHEGLVTRRPASASDAGGGQSP